MELNSTFNSKRRVLLEHLRAELPGARVGLRRSCVWCQVSEKNKRQTEWWRGRILDFGMGIWELLFRIYPLLCPQH
jgi:hypothetical protein